MFGFSIQKLLVLVAIIAAVWYGFKWIGRLDQTRKAQAKERVRSAAKERARSAARRDAETEAQAEDMVLCPVCNAYVPARGASHCGRGDCPY
ncbi:MAG: hypothetical protein MI920_27140 [Kiloniellales bacterium]|nr:hypothetical protein [Kiloniellales bacterium]